MDRRKLRRQFLLTLRDELGVVWPALSALIAVMVALGIVIGLRERWPIHDALYFTFVTGLTIGYGDLVPTHPLTRMLAALIGVMGIMMTALLAAVAVRALPGIPVEEDKRD